MRKCKRTQGKPLSRCALSFARMDFTIALQDSFVSSAPSVHPGRGLVKSPLRGCGYHGVMSFLSTLLSWRGGRFVILSERDMFSSCTQWSRGGCRQHEKQRVVPQLIHPYRERLADGASPHRPPRAPVFPHPCTPLRRRRILSRSQAI